MEDTILLVIQQFRVEGISQLLALISALGNSALIWIVIALVFLLFQERRQAGVVMLITIILTSVLTIAISGIIGRPSPADAITGLVPVVGVSYAGSSFPSFHAATAFAAATVAFLSSSRSFGLLCMVLAIVESLSRVFLCVNYPSDVLVGAVGGVVVGYICCKLLMRAFGMLNIQQRTPSRKTINTHKGRHSR